MAITNKQLLTEPDRYKYYNEREKKAAQDFASWSGSDVQDYYMNKTQAQLEYDKTGQWNSNYAAANQALRDKYGMAEDRWHANDIGRLASDYLVGDFISYGLRSGDPSRQNIAKNVAGNWYDSLLPDDDYYGGYGPGGGGYGSGMGGYGGPQLPPMPQMRSGRSMAELLGVIYDLDEIEGKWTDAVNKKYANLEQEVRRTQDMYYDTIGNSADMLMGALRRGDRDAVQSGTAQGTQAAQELSALLGVSADAGQGATELAQGRDDLVRDRETELAKVAVDALKYYNQLGLDLGQLSASELNALVTAYASEVATIGGIYNTDVLASVERDRIQSQENIANADRISRENIATWGNASAEEIARITGMSAVEVEEIRERYNKEIANINAQMQKEISKNQGSRGPGGSYTTPSTAASAWEQSAVIFSMFESLPKDEEGQIKRDSYQQAYNYMTQVENIMGLPSGTFSEQYRTVEPAPRPSAPGKEDTERATFNSIYNQITEEQKKKYPGFSNIIDKYRNKYSPAP